MKKETISPTFITLLARSTSSTVTVVPPRATSPFTWFAPVIFCSYAVEVAQIETLSELPQSPALLAAQGPILPCPSLNEPV